MSMLWLKVVMVVAMTLVCQAHGGYGGFPATCNNRLHKLLLNQTGYVQYAEYMADIPRLQAFTMHYWFNLNNVARTSTTFNYALDTTSNNNLTVQLERSYGREEQHWTLQINDLLVSRVASPPVYPGVWHHMLHSWDSFTGLWSVFMDAELLGHGYSLDSVGSRIPGGGLAVSGQHQRAHLNMGMDDGEGMEGWFTLFQMSNRALPNPDSDQAATLVSSLASRCSQDLGGDLITWRGTPRKGYGGVTETPGRQQCGNF